MGCGILVENNKQKLAMKLEDFVEIKSGRTFKNGIPISDEPTHSVIQLRDFDKDNDQRPIRWEQLSRTNLASSKIDNSLKTNDVLIVAKAPFKKAIFLNSVPQNVVANQHFFILTVKNNEEISPEFLVHYLNSSESQRWMNDNSGGSFQSAISKKVLSQLPLPDISIEKQNHIAEAAKSARCEVFLHNQLIKSREQEVDLIFQDFWADIK